MRHFIEQVKKIKTVFHLLINLTQLKNILRIFTSIFVVSTRQACPNFRYYCNKVIHVLYLQL